MEGGTFGAAVDANDNAWFTSYGSKSIRYSKGRQTPNAPRGDHVRRQAQAVQGVIVTPSGDVWVLGIEKSQLVYFPKGDLTKGRIVCEGDSVSHADRLGAIYSASTSRTEFGCPIAA